MRVVLTISEFKMKIDKVVDSVVGDISDPLIINAILTLFEGSVKVIINTFLKKGFSLEWILQLLHIDFLTFDATALMPFDDYFLFFCTPKFNIDIAIDNIKKRLHGGLQSLFSADDDLEISQDMIE